MMEVIYCKVGEPAKLVEVDGTLEDFQKMVGGHIEVVSYEGISGLVYVLNEEGKLEGLKPNKSIFGGNDMIVGDFFVEAIGADDIVGLNERQKEFVMRTVDFGRMWYL